MCSYVAMCLKKNRNWIFMCYLIFVGQMYAFLSDAINCNSDAAQNR